MVLPMRWKYLSTIAAGGINPACYMKEHFGFYKKII